MKKKLVLHFGEHKTGSTSIQTFLINNRKALADRDFYYPAEGSYYLNYESSQSLLAYSILNMHPSYLGKLRFDKQTCISELNRDISASSHANVIISSEQFSHARTVEELRSVWEVVAPLFETIEIIVYLRRQDFKLESSWKQIVVTGQYNKSFDKYRGECFNRTPSEKTGREGSVSRYYEYYNFLCAITEVFGKSNVVVRPFERTQLYGRDVVRDFLNVLGISMDVHNFQQLNSSPPAELVELLRYLNKASKSAEEYRGLSLFLLRMPFAFDKVRYSFLTDEDRKNILDLCRESNFRVATEFMDRECGELFNEPEDVSLPLYPGLTLDRMAEIMAHATLVLGQANAQLASKLRSLRPAPGG